MKSLAGIFIMVAPSTLATSLATVDLPVPFNPSITIKGIEKHPGHIAIWIILSALY